MKTVQMTLDESLVQEVDRAAQALGTTRDAFTRDALCDALGHLRERELERRHRAGYERKPSSRASSATGRTNTEKTIAITSH